MSEPLAITTSVPLAPRTTLKLGGPAAHFVEATQEAQVEQAVAWARAHGLPLLVLGGGSNLVVGDAGFDGLVLHMATQGLQARPTAEGIELQAAAGESWDAFVAYATRQGWAGIECLGGIPGCVGATPIQNVGAYGQDVSQTITRVEVLDRTTLARRWLQPQDLAFGYRDSWLRRNPDAFVVLQVVFLLRPGAANSPRYAELAQALAANPHPTVEDIRQTVIRLRRKKSMVLDPSDPNTTSAGSFFTNPVVDQATAQFVVDIALQRGLAAHSSEVPQWPAGQGQVKLAAAWLIERAGFSRGQRAGAMGISTAHALALVHHGGGTAQELVAFARTIAETVWRTFHVRLSPEPIFVGLAL